MIAQQDTVFTATNWHTPSCGQAPDVANTEPANYYGYFENEYGEQWVLVYDRKQYRGVLRGGDAGWENEFVVIGDDVQGVILCKSEQAWLRACLKAACPT
jgi:hypothetical protein